MLFFSFSFFTKLDQMSRVGSRGRHPKCRPKKLVLTSVLNSAPSKYSLALLFEVALKRKRSIS